MMRTQNLLLKEGIDFMKYYENGIENLKGTFEEVKELFNKFA